MPELPGTPLDEEARAKVVTLTRAGLTADQIAMVLGVSDRTVTRVRVQAGIAHDWQPPLSEDEIRRAAVLLEDGASYSEAARTIGRSARAVARALPGRGWTRQQCYELVATVQRHRHLLRSLPKVPA